MIMICPLCKEKGKLTQYEFDPDLYGCSECYGTWSKTYLIGYHMGYLDGQKCVKEEPVENVCISQK